LRLLWVPGYRPTVLYGGRAIRNEVRGVVGTLLRAICVAVALLPAAGAFPAAGDDGPPHVDSAAVRPSRTTLRPLDLPELAPKVAPGRSGREVVLLVAGIGSSSSDRTWDALIGRLRADPRYEVRRFGADPEHPYDTVGRLSDNADALTAEVRELATRYGTVHLIAHSMGGAVVDTALARGLSASDGVRTYIALAAPHDGSTAARYAQVVAQMAGDARPEARAIASIVQGRDIAGPATEDLARLRLGATAAGIARLDLRMASDVAVIERDAAVPGVDARVLLPRGAGEWLDGHGAITSDPRALDLVTTTVARRAAPSDMRGVEIAQAARTSRIADAVMPWALGLAAVCLIAACWALRRRRLPFVRTWANARNAGLARP